MGAESVKKSQQLPYGISPEDNQRRLKLFKQMDMNNNGYLSLAQIDKGIRDVIAIPELFDTKPVLMRAYQEARKKLPSKHSYGDDYVSKAQFRYLLMYLRVFWQLYEDFKRIDTDGQDRISQQQFINGQKYLQRWGVVLKNPYATYSILLNRYKAKNHITFTQFCHWMSTNYLKNFNTPYPDHDILF